MTARLFAREKGRIMKILNLLNSQAMIDFFGKTYDISLDWIGELIKLLINGVGIVGVGIILFSLIFSRKNYPLCEGSQWLLVYYFQVLPLFLIHKKLSVNTF